MVLAGVPVCVLCRDDIRHTLLTFGQGAGLVEQHDVDVACLLKGAAVAHEQAIFGTQCRGDLGDQRDGKTERVRAGNDQHGYDALQHEAGLVWAKQQPHHEGDQRCDERHREQPGRGTVSENLRP